MDEVRRDKLDRYGWRILIGSALFPFIQAVFFFLGAWGFNFPRVWAYAVFGSVLLIGFVVPLARANPELLNHRGRWKLKTDAPKWDQVLVRFFGLLGFYLPPVIAGLDVGKYQWSVLPLWAWYAGAVLFVIGNIIMFWAMFTNTHFEAMVRIQTDRNHTVVMNGPYRIVRHPGYVGAIFWAIGPSLMWGSAVSLIPVLIACLLLVWRTYKEDCMLQEELADYKEYTQRVRYRLIWGLW